MHFSWFHNKLEVSTSSESKEINLHLWQLPGLPSEHGLYNISSVLTPFTLNWNDKLHITVRTGTHILNSRVSLYILLIY